MRQPRAVTIYSAAQTRAAADAAGDHGVLLLSPPAAAGFIGPAWFAQMVAGHAPAALDCGADPGHALAALRFGLKLIILSDPQRGLLSCAAEVGAKVLPVRPPSLDLFNWALDRTKARDALRAWLIAEAPFTQR
ncbi:MAG: hypothetical protein V4653_20280 [Pseudomonadota bacterium]